MCFFHFVFLIRNISIHGVFYDFDCLVSLITTGANTSNAIKFGIAIIAFSTSAKISTVLK